MAEENIYKAALKHGLRFDTRHGVIDVEDLFHLGLTQLDEIYRELKAEERGAAVESLSKARTQEDTLLDLKIEIVRDVYETIKADRQAIKAAVERRARKQKLLAIKAKKQEAALEAMTEEELDQMIAEL